MQEILINNNLKITNVEEMIGSLNRCTYSQITMEDLKEYFDSGESIIFYIDKNLNSSMCEQPDSSYVWLDTGLKRGSKPIFISLYKKFNTYEGYYIGDADRLAESMCMYPSTDRKAINANLQRFKEKYNKKRNEVSKDKITTVILRENNENQECLIVDKKSKEIQEEMSLYEEIYNSLLINNWKNRNGLERFIKIIGCRAEQLILAGKREYYIINNIKSVVVKTGLLDKYATDILVLYKWNMKQNGYVAEKMIKSKKELVEEGFSKEEIQRNIKTISFFDGEESLKGIQQEDFDLNTDCLKHILEDRRERFPEEVVSCTADFLAGKLRESLAMGLKILEHDTHYVKPSYSAKSKSITWLMPFYVYRSLSDEPELVMAIRMDSEQIYYEVKTILPYNDEIKDKITALSLYGNSW